MSRKQGEISERERVRRQRQAEQEAAKKNPKFADPNAKGRPEVAHAFGLVPRHQKKTGRGA